MASKPKLFSSSSSFPLNCLTYTLASFGKLLVLYWRVKLWPYQTGLLQSSSFFFFFFPLAFPGSQSQKLVAPLLSQTRLGTRVTNQARGSAICLLSP